MVQVVSHETSSIVIGGDFNIMRHPDEKNKDNFEQRWPTSFNVVI
jgi:hypothetical protein